MRFALLAGLVVAVTLVPAASAQGYPVQAYFVIRSVEVDDSLLTPDLDRAMVRVDWDYVASFPTTQLLAQGQTATLVWDFQGCSMLGVTMLGSMSEALQIPFPWTTGTLEGASKFTVQASSEAPGEEVIECMLVGQVGAAGPVPPTQPAQGAFQVAAAYDGGIAAATQHRVQEGAPGSILRFPIEVANLANSESKVATQLANTLPAGWTVSLPEPVILESVTKGGMKTNTTLVVEVKVPRDAEAVAAPIQIILDAGSVKDEAMKAAPVVVNLIASVSGAAAPGVAQAGGGGKIAPGVGPLLAVGLLGLAMLVRRRSA